MSLLEVRMSCIDMFLQACPNINLEYVAVLDECCPSGGLDISLKLLVLDVFFDGVSLPQVDVGFNVLDVGVVDIYWLVFFHHHICLRLIHLHSLIFSFISQFL